MSKFVSRICGVAAALVLAAAVMPAVAKEAAAQSGPAAAAREVRGDWTVGCAAPAQGQPDGKVCTFAQEQSDGQSKQRVLALELQPDGTGAKGVLVLPFGLDVQKDVTLQVDDGKPFSVSRIHSCLPIGCALGVKLDAATMAQLGNGKSLKVNAVVDGGKDVSFGISLKGFEEAFNRTLALAQSA